MAVNEERNEKNHRLQVLEKQLLKTSEDYDMTKSKFESFKDIEIVSRVVKHAIGISI